MDAFLTSSLLVAVAEIGDKTQLLAIVLATRFRKPVPIILGILAATIANHALAAFAGHFAAGLIDGFWFRVAVAASFVAMGLWTLVPDKLDADEAPRTHEHRRRARRPAELVKPQRLVAARGIELSQVVAGALPDFTL